MHALLTAFRSAFRVAWRYRWTFAVPIATLVLPAVVYAVRLPDEYRAHALVHTRAVLPEHIGRGLPEELSSRPEEILATARARLRARGPIEAAAAVLYPDDDPKSVDSFERTRAGLAYEQIGTAAFSVSVGARNPEDAAEASNALVLAFVESERAERVRRAENNHKFHQRELVTARATYRDALTALDEYRTNHAETLPESRDGTREVMRRTATEIAAQNTVIASARSRMQGLDEQIASLKATLPTGTVAGGSGAGAAMQLQLTQAQRALHAAQKELAEKRSRYTEEHPDVLRLKTATSVYETAVREAVAALKRLRTQALGEAEESAKRLLSSHREGLLVLREAAVADIERAEARKVVLRDREAALQKIFVAIPATEAALGPIHRELDEAEKVLTIRQQDAAAARAAVEFYSNGECSDVTRYRVDAWATVPLHPSAPARWRYFVAALLLGVLIGYGLLLLQGKLEGRPVEGADDLSGSFSNAVIVEIPDLGASSMRLPRFGDVLMTGYVTACFAAVVVAIAVQRGWAQGPAWIQDLLQG